MTLGGGCTFTSLRAMPSIMSPQLSPFMQKPLLHCHRPSPSFVFVPSLSLRMVSTREKNANAHPGRIVLEGQQPQCTRKQIEDDKACSQAAKSRNNAIHHSNHDHLKQMENLMENEEEAQCMHVMRPDLRHPGPPGEGDPTHSEWVTK